MEWECLLVTPFVALTVGGIAYYQSGVVANMNQVAAHT
jgi:hypothetical protein